MSVRDVLTQSDLSFTPSEEKLVQLLLADYPIAGLGTANSLARKAGVSDPTVTRLLVKLGFAGFPDFQSKLLADVEAGLQSPLHMMEAKRGRSDGNAAIAYLRSVAKAVDKTMTATPVRTYDRAAKLTMAARQVLLIGGRFSRHAAGMLASYLLQFRSGVRDISALSAQEFDALIDYGKKDVLVAFDYRRYQRDVVSFAEQAADQGVRVVLFTDQWLSPIADVAEVTIVAPQEVASPYDTIVPAIAQMEALVATIVTTLSDETKARIERLEAIRKENAVTIDARGRAR